LWVLRKLIWLLSKKFWESIQIFFSPRLRTYYCKKKAHKNAILTIFEAIFLSCQIFCDKISQIDKKITIASVKPVLQFKNMFFSFTNIIWQILLYQIWYKEFWVLLFETYVNIFNSIYDQYILVCNQFLRTWS
jgi:hypothetical protein